MEEFQLQEWDKFMRYFLFFLIFTSCQYLAQHPEIEKQLEMDAESVAEIIIQAEI